MSELGILPLTENSFRRRHVSAILAVALAALATHCAKVPADPAAAVVPAHAVAATPTIQPASFDGAALPSQATAVNPSPAYILRPGDVIQVKFFFNDELNETAPIRPDGKITLQLIGEVDTLGLSPVQLGERLSQRFAYTLRQPEVSVNVVEFASQKVYVGGEVAVPGLLEMDSNLTALQAIFQAGGIRETAELRSVVLLRYQGTAEPAVMTLDLKSDLEGGEQRHDLLLRPYDIVYVPKTGIATVNLWIRQHITEIVPISFVLGLNYLWPSPTVFP